MCLQQQALALYNYYTEEVRVHNMRKKTRRFNRFGGFTLIEIMVAIAIISILVSLVVQHIMRARANARLRACVQNLRAIATAIEMCQIDHPEFFDHRAKSTTPKVIEEGNILIGVIVGMGYLAEVPRCPNGDSYSYKVGTSAERKKVGHGYWHIAHQTKNIHKDAGLKDWYPYYRSDVGICYYDDEH